ncbi:MAG: TIGR00282 family metallophosphoesterase [Sphaerochaetaceae bacterium]|nr:TIGR00282 family metallophosphoesterase [Sphaerochaetaceae bacterium]
MASRRTVTALLLGDVIGRPGCRALFITLPQLIRTYRADCVIVNGENADEGFGLTRDIADQLFAAGVNVITSGNHIWQREEFLPTLKSDSRILRPANYHASAPGVGHTVINLPKAKIGVINLQGRHQLPPIENPFTVASSIVDRLSKNCDAIIVDFHAELPQEKQALAHYLDGKVSALVGTHTHVQTMDERILANGTAYITDLGMCGPFDSVIGSDPSIAIERQLAQIPYRNQILDAPASIQGVVVTIDLDTKKARSIKRIKVDAGV